MIRSTMAAAASFVATLLPTLIATLIAGGLATATPAAAGQDVLWRSLTTATLSEELVGTVVEGLYNDGRHFTENMQPNLSTHYEADDITTDGRYWVAEDRLCFAYTAPISTGCFEVWQRSKNCYDNYFMPEDSEPASTLAQRMLGLGWDSRMWRTAEPSTCPADAVARAGVPTVLAAAR